MMIKKNKYEKDLLDRTSIISNLSQLISATTEPLVFALNAPWGAGKTIFVKELWRPFLAKEHGIKSFYFSVWEDDFSKEPLVTILGGLDAYIKEHTNSKQKIKKKFDEVSKFAVDMIKTGLLPGVVKSATGGLVDVDLIMKKITTEIITKYAEEKQLIQQFKKALTELIDEIQTDKNKPFVIFIDELDRCRPLYAIEFLERIKHLFGIERLIFVLSIDKKQLAISIKSQYGNIDTNNYLRRFVDIEYILPEGNINNFCNTLYKNFNLSRIFKDNQLDIFKFCIKIFKPSLRTLEQIFLKLNIIFKTKLSPTSSESLLGSAFPFIQPIVFLEFLKSYDSTLYDEFIKGKKKEALRDLLAPYKNNNLFNNNILRAIIEVTGLKDSEVEQLIEQEKKNKTEDSEYYIKTLNLESFISIGYFYDYDYYNQLMDNAIKDVEFAEAFGFDAEY